MTVEDQTHRLAALYEELADVRATQIGVMAHARRAIGIQEYESRMDALGPLSGEENGILEQIEALGGEDPEL